MYCHLPKCAGTTVVEHLSTLRQAYSIQYNNVEASFQNYLGTPNNGKFVYGHFRHQQMEALEDSGRQYKMFTFLRDPIERLVSAYRYTVYQGPNASKYRQKWPTFEAYAEWYPANDVAAWLIGGAESVDEYIEKLEARFDFIGVQEHFDKSMARLMRLLGSEYRPGPRRNVTQAPEVSTYPDLRAYLYEKHRLDVEAWREVTKKHYDTIHRTSTAE